MSVPGPSQASAVGSIAGALLRSGLDRLGRREARLAFEVQPPFTFKIHGDGAASWFSRPRRLLTTRVSIVNHGKADADDVELTLSESPTSISLRPPRHYDTRRSAQGWLTLDLGRLSAGEILEVELLAIGDAVPEVEAVRSASGVAKCSPLSGVERRQRWRRLFDWGITIGASFAFMAFILAPLFRMIAAALLR
jgi:hypothetical protein